jgi:hypothetical protein
LFQGTAGATTTKTVGQHVIIGIACTSSVAGDTLNVRFGSAANAPTATAADWAVPAGTVQFFDLGQEFDRVAIFSATTPKYYIYVFSRT